MDSKTKSLIIMYHEIHRLRNTEGFSIQRIADGTDSIREISAHPPISRAICARTF